MMNDTKGRMLTDSTPKYVKTSVQNNLHTNVEQSSMFHITAHAKYIHFQKRLQYSPI